MATLAVLVSRQLTQDLVWREAELAYLRKQLALAPAKGIAEQVLLRSGVALVYAHYEGFCKFAFNVYIDALDKLKLSIGSLSWPLATHSLKKLCDELRAEDDRREFFELLLNEFNPSLTAQAAYERPPQISNLWPDLLESWLKKLGLTATEVRANNALLESLVSNRNQIAHGKKLVIKSRVDLDKYLHAAQLAMHEIAVGVVESVEHGHYKRSGAATHTLNHAP